MKTPQRQTGDKVVALSAVQTQPAFSFLKDFVLVDPPKKAGTKQGDALTVARNRVIAGLTKQKERVQLILDGKPIPKMEGGKKQAATWFYKAADGQYETRLRYGQSAIPLEGGKEGVRVGKLEDLIPFYDAVAAAIQKGELDEQLKVMQAKKSDSLRGV